MTDTAYGYMPEAAAHTAAYMVIKIGRPLSDEALIRLLYLAERQHAKTRFHAIFNDHWLASPRGPYCYNAMLGLIGLADFTLWNTLFYRQINNLVCCRENVTVDQLDRLSKAITITCDTIVSEFGAKNDGEIFEWMRENLPENANAPRTEQITAHAMALSIGFENPEEFVANDAESRSIRHAFATME